jgi:CO dehydrogenase maturation factor
MAVTIAISGKGGTGKSTISALMVRALLGRSGRGVLAVDADPNSCLGLMLGVKPVSTVAQLREDALKKPSERGEGVDRMRSFEYGLQQAVTEEKGFDLLTMGRPEGPGCYCAVNNMLRKFLDEAANAYDFVIIDNEAGMEHLSRRTTNDVDVLFIVAQTTTIGIIAVKRIFELTGSLPINVGKIGVIWNMEGGAGRELEGIGTFGCVPCDEAVEEVCVNGRTIFELEDKSAAFSAVRQILNQQLSIKEKIT